MCKHGHFSLKMRAHIACPRSSDPFHIVSYYIKWDITSWTNSVGSDSVSVCGTNKQYFPRKIAPYLYYACLNEK